MKIIRWAVAGVSIYFLLITFLVIKEKAIPPELGALLSGLYVGFFVLILGNTALGLINWGKTGDLEPAKTFFKTLLMKLVCDLTFNTQPKQFLKPLTKKQVIFYSIAVVLALLLADFLKEKEEKARKSSESALSVSESAKGKAK